MVHLTCPGCGESVQEVSYSKKFLFHDGVRKSAGWTWDFSCCGAQVLDDQIEFTYQENGGYYVSTLTDPEDNVILSWLDEVEANQDDG